MRISFYNKLRLIAIICVLLLAGFQYIFPGKDFKSLERQPEPEGLINGVEVYELKNYPIVDRRVTQAEKWGGLQPIQHLSIKTGWDNSSGFIGINAGENSSYYTVDHKGRNGISSLVSASHYESNVVNSLNTIRVEKLRKGSDSKSGWLYEYHTKKLPYNLGSSSIGLKSYTSDYKDLYVARHRDFYFTGELFGQMERLISCTIRSSKSQGYCSHSFYMKGKGVKVDLAYPKSEISHWRRTESKVIKIVNAMFDGDPTINKSSHSVPAEKNIVYQSNGKKYAVPKEKVERYWIASNSHHSPVRLSIPYTQDGISYDVIVSAKTLAEHQTDIDARITSETNQFNSQPKTISTFQKAKNSHYKELKTAITNASIEKESKDDFLHLKTISENPSLEAWWNITLSYNKKNNTYQICHPGTNERNILIQRLVSDPNKVMAHIPCTYISYHEEIGAEITTRFQDENKPNLKDLEEYIKNIIMRKQ